LCWVAVGAEQLKVFHRRRAAERDRQDVVVLEVEAGLAFHALPTVTLEDNAADFDWNRYARRSS
jgi:hypothetical protein